MEHSASVTSLVIVILAAFITPILLHRLKLTIIPVVVAEIIIGLIIGKSGFDVVHPGSWLEILSTLGFIFLMFLSGLEIDFSIFGRKKRKQSKQEEKGSPNPVVVALLIFCGIFVLSLGLSQLFVLAGFIDNAFLMTLIISTISLGVVVPTLKDAQMMKTSIGQTILLVAVIADLATMILLAVFVSLYGEDGGNTWLLLVLFGAGVLLYFVGKQFRHQSYLETMAKGTIHIDTRAVFTLIIVLVALSETVGAENILGAFLAGTLVSLLSPDPDMVKKLDSFGYGFLIPIFFVMVGVDIDIWNLFTDSRVVVLIPLLFIALLVSKIFPAFLLRKWYDMKTVMSAGFLLTSTLSLVIAAATIGEREGMIDKQMEGALVLVAVLTCIAAPIVFKKLYGRFEEEDHKQVVSFIGSNRMTLPVVRELDAHLFETHLYHTKLDSVDEKISRSCFDIRELNGYQVEEMKELGVFDVDILVASTGEEHKNAEIAKFAKAEGVEHVIVRVESSELDQEMKDHDISVFSVFLSSKALLKAMIEAPNVVDIFTQQDSALYQINMNNSSYDGMYIKEFPFTGDVIMVRIFRGNESIVPHGDTQLMMNDRLIVTGSTEYVDELRMQLEYCEWY
ncbi:cation:proton antiporter [Halobacillus rhizosphaerae]|uniref:cation:proton antiporter domain-containing protein n=1 Tax=Halobacillus rhizosphaerae TaxID=3064889 RepID=UPI00398A6CE6